MHIFKSPQGRAVHLTMGHLCFDFACGKPLGATDVLFRRPQLAQVCVSVAAVTGTHREGYRHLSTLHGIRNDQPTYDISFSIGTVLNGVSENV